MTAQNTAHASFVQLQLFEVLPPQPSIFALRAVRNLYIGDALRSDDLLLVRDQDDNGTDYYVVYEAGIMQRTYISNTDSVHQQIALWLDKRGYNRQNATVVQDYAYQHVV